MIDLANILVGPVTALLDKFIADKDERARLAHEIATLSARQAHEIQKLQVQTNQKEAAHKSLFVAGWRPGAGWVCVLALFNNYVVAPYVNAFMPITLPSLNMGELMPVLLGMLGLGAARSWEKNRGIAREK